MIAASATESPEAFGSSLPAGEQRNNLELVRRYLAAIEASADAEPAENRAFEFLDPRVVQIEYPNQFVPNGATRDLAAMREAAIRGHKVLLGQRYETHTAIAYERRVALEVVWVGTLAVAIGALPVGGEMQAHFGVFFELQGGKIVKQTNYDCFDPF